MSSQPHRKQTPLLCFKFTLIFDHSSAEGETLAAAFRKDVTLPNTLYTLEEAQASAGFSREV